MKNINSTLAITELKNKKISVLPVKVDRDTEIELLINALAEATHLTHFKIEKIADEDASSSTNT